MTSIRHPARKLTYEDYCRIPEDRCRHEILDGEHVVSPAPYVAHQLVLGRLHAELFAQLERRKLGRVLFAPTDVRLGPHDVVQPDLLAIRPERASIITLRWIEGPPDLVVEVLSPSTGRRDRGLKAARYATFGVREYWLIDTDARTIEQFELEGDRYVLRQTATATLRSLAFPDVALDLAQLWA